MQMPAAIRAYMDRVDAFTLRERALIFLAGAAIVVSAAYNVLLQPVLVAQGALSAKMQQQREEMRNWDLQIGALAGGKAAATGGEKRAQIASLQKRAEELDRQIGARRSQLVPPSEMRALLADVLRRNRSLRLVSLATLPAERIGGAQDTRTGQLYRHGIELTVAGSYLDLTSYLSDLERLPAKIFWGDMQLAADYPSATLKVSLYTLSPEKTWLAL